MSGAPVTAARRHILIGESDPELLLRLQRAVANGRTETSIIVASSASKLLEILDQGPVDAVLLDDGLPGSDCLTLLEAIQRRARPPPVIMISSQSREEVMTAALRLGASDYLVKRDALDRTLPLMLERAIEQHERANRDWTAGQLNGQLNGQRAVEAVAARNALAVRGPPEGEPALEGDAFQHLVEAAADAIYVLEGRRFRYVNRRFADLFGRTREALTSPDFEVSSLIAPESRALVGERMRRAEAREPLPPRYEFRALREEGTAFDVEVSVSYVRDHGRNQVLGIVQDITARKAYERTLLRKNHELSVLNAIAEATNQTRDLPAILEGVVVRLIELLEVHAAGIQIIEPGTSRFSSVHYRGASETFVREMRTKPLMHGVIGLALTTKSLQVIPDILADERTSKGAAAREGFRSAVTLPLISQGEVSGVVTVFTREPRPFSQDEVALFVAVSRQIAAAIENAWLYKKARDGIARLQALSELARAIGSTLDVEGVFRIVGDRLRRLVPYHRIVLNIVRREGPTFSVRSMTRPLGGESLVVRLHEPLVVEPSSPVLRALESKTAVVVPPGTAPAGKAHPAYPIDECVSAIVPIVADSSVLGVFVVAIDRPDGFTEFDLDLLKDLAAHMAISLKNAAMFQDLERAYRDLRDFKDRLVRSEKLQSLGEMAAGVAHDFNNVLSAILGRAQMLKVLLTDEETLKSLRVIERAALDGAGTVRRIQEFAKAKSEGQFVRIRLNGLVRDAVDLTTTRVRDLGLDIETQVDLGDAGTVLGNSTELREVLTNLIHNAVDAMPHGGLLAVRSGKTEASEPWFEVQDTGIGMTEDVQKKIFDPFFTTKGVHGTGLGLSVSYGIVQRHRGEFVVDSERGRGTRIRVVFPADEQPSTGFGDVDSHHESRGPITGAHLVPGALPGQAGQLGQAAQFGLATQPGLGAQIGQGTQLGQGRSEAPAKILVIDDDEAVRDVLADMLRTADHVVEAVASGQEGVERLKTQEFDVVFTDLGMPGMNGWEVAQIVKRLWPATPVGLITGWGAALDEAPMKERGVDLIVAKPFRYNQVLGLVGEALTLRKDLTKSDEGDQGIERDLGDLGDEGDEGDEGELDDADDAGDPGDLGSEGEFGNPGDLGSEGEFGDPGDLGHARGEKGVKESTSD